MKDVYTTPNGYQLLKEWSNHDYERNTARATTAAQRLQPYLYFEHGTRCPFAGDSFGLPYTSSGAFAAVWNTNAAARLILFPALYFEGVAIDASGAPVAIFTERDEIGNEKNTLFIKVRQ